MVAPQLDRFDLWVDSVDEEADDRDVLGFLKLLAAPVQATASGTPLPNVVSVSYGSAIHGLRGLGVPHPCRPPTRGVRGAGKRSRLTVSGSTGIDDGGLSGL